MRMFHNNLEITKNIEKMDLSDYGLTYVSGDFIYIASDFPFNHLYIKLSGTLNVVSSTMKVEYLCSNAWQEVVDLKDETNHFTQSGYVEFTPNRNSSWNRKTESDGVGISKVLYDKYWARISFDVTITPSIELSFIGYKFSEDSDLYTEYPIFNNSDFLNAFQTGKTSWEEQHAKAAEIISSDLTKKSVIIAPEQILERRKFIGASSCKVAEIIYSAFGNDYLSQKKEANDEYHRRLDLSQYAIDANGDAILQPVELQAKQGWLSR
jgi:hypothetical protein